MAPKLFVTGATGYIGGDALAAIIDKHADWEITCLVRSSDKGAKIAAVYAHVKLVYGNLDDIDLIEEEAFKADIVYHFANNDHVPSAQAISRGLARHDGPSYWIHTSGTFVLGHECLKNNIYGEPTAKVFNDWDGIGEITSVPYDSPHRPVDELVLGAHIGYPNIKTAIVCPPTIYGVGRGPDNQRSMQAYFATEVFLKHQRAFKIGKGTNIYNQVHVHDLAQIYLLLGEAAAEGSRTATWNEEGYYLAEIGEFVWGDILQEIANVAHKKGLLPSNEVVSLSPDDQFVLDSGLKVDIGSTARGDAIRAKKVLGWKPKERTLKEEVPDMVESEAKRLGLIKGHAEQVKEQRA